MKVFTPEYSAYITNTSCLKIGLGERLKVLERVVGEKGSLFHFLLHSNLCVVENEDGDINAFGADISRR